MDIGRRALVIYFKDNEKLEGGGDGHSESDKTKLAKKNGKFALLKNFPKFLMRPLIDTR